MASPAVIGAGAKNEGGGGEMGSAEPLLRLFDLVRQGDFAEAERRLEASPELWRAADPDGLTLLHWASLGGSAALVRGALRAGAAVDVASASGQTPLMWAMIGGSLDTARALLEAGADAHVRDSKGATPFVLAVQHQRHLALLLLVALEPREKLLAGADDNGCGPVHWAAYKGDLQSLKLLRYFDADFSASDGMGMTALHRAVQASQAGVCEFLLDCGVDPSCADQQGRTCLDVANGLGDAATCYALDGLLESASACGSGCCAGRAGAGGRLRRRELSRGEAERLRRRALQSAAPTAWLVCVSLALFEYLVDLRPVSWSVAPLGAVCFELAVPATLALFFAAARGDPGRIQSRVKGHSGVEEVLEALRAGRSPDFGRLCTTTWVLKGLRTKYCTQTGECVDEFDQYCCWLNTAVGRGNHRTFVVLIAVEAFAQLCQLYLCLMCARHLVQAPVIADWAVGVVSQYPMLVLVAALHAVTLPGVVFICLNQLLLIGINVTTNEMLNGSRYDHFWEEAEVGGGKKQRRLKNPFDKGGFVANCLDFWWERRRGQVRAETPTALQP